MEPDRWLGVEIRHLAALQAVVEEGSFGRAARRLGYTQSAVSQQIATLERIVGERLLERPGGPRAVSPTEAGELLLRHAEAIVARLRAAQADLAALSEGGAGSLRVGTFQSVGARILPAVMRRFAATWPQVAIALAESNSDEELLSLVEQGELDLAFSVLPLPEGPLEAVELLRDPWVLVVPRESPLAARRTPVTPTEIADLALIGYRSCRSTAQVESHLYARGIEPRFVFRSNDNGTVQGLVGAGVGAALVPRLALEASDENVVSLELDAKVPPRLIAVVWHRDRYRSPAARAFVETAEAVCGEAADRGAGIAAAAR
jgi:DNA-binding transcriptional LysR family regulator